MPCGKYHSREPKVVVSEGQKKKMELEAGSQGREAPLGMALKVIEGFVRSQDRFLWLEVEGSSRKAGVFLGLLGQ